MAKAKSDAVWQEIDPTTLHPDLQEAYKAYKDAYAEMKRMRAGFEERINAEVKPPVGKRVAVAYNFGKLSIALVADERKPEAQPKLSLAQYLAREAGR